MGLRGRLFDDRGNAMSPVQSRRGQRCYRYYVSQALLKGEKDNVGSVARLPAHELDAAVVGSIELALVGQAHYGPVESILAALKKLDAAARLWTLAALIERVVVHRTRLRIMLDRSVLCQGVDPDDQDEEADDALAALMQIEVPLRIERRRGSTRILAGPEQVQPGPGPDAALLKALVRGHLWSRELLAGKAASVGEIAESVGVTPCYVSRMLRMAYLAPDITDAILAGRQPASLTVEVLRDPIPLDWREQRARFGFAPAA